MLIYKIFFEVWISGGDNAEEKMNTISIVMYELTIIKIDAGC